MNNTLKAVIAATVIFGSGVLTGVYLVKPKIESKRPDAPVNLNDEKRVVFVNKLDKQLSLEDTQKAKIIEILTESNERTRALWDPIADKMREEISAVRDEIRAELTPRQQERFDKKISKPRRLNQLPRKPKVDPEAEKARMEAAAKKKAEEERLAAEKAKAEADRLAAEKRRKEAEAKRRAEAKKRADQLAKKKAEEEARKKAEAEKKKKEDELKLPPKEKTKEEIEAEKNAEEARKQAAEEKKRKDEARKKAQREAAAKKAAERKKQLEEKKKRDAQKRLIEAKKTPKKPAPKPAPKPPAKPKPKPKAEPEKKKEATKPKSIRSLRSR